MKRGSIKLCLAILLILSVCAYGSLQDGLIAHYTFNGDANDSSGNDLHGQVTGTALADGRLGDANNAFSFDGLDDYVRVPDTAILDGMNALTMAAWVNTDGSDGTQSVINKYLHHSDIVLDDSYILRLTEYEEVSLQYAIGSVRVIHRSTAALPIESWHHIVGVYTSTDGIIYIDGNRVALSHDGFDPGGPLNSIDEDLLLGCGNNNGVLHEFFDGLIDDIRIYNRALSDTEVSDLYQFPESATLSVVEPNGTEVLYSADFYTIDWSSTGTIGDVLIEYTTDNGENWSVVNTVPNTGSYNWLVPAYNSTQCLVRISDNNYPSINDVSDDIFTIEINDMIRMVPGQYLTIQEAINDANDGDTVLVSQGRYYENIDFWGKAITVTSTDPNDPDCVYNTIIDANGDEPDDVVVSFHMSEGPNSVLAGFTITGGNAQYGSGIVCWQNCSPTIADCNISGNSATEYGGGMYCAENANVVVMRCVFNGNSAYQGGGMYCNYSNAVLTNCTFNGNSAVTFGNGGGMCCNYSNAVLTNCTFNGNSAYQGGGMYIKGRPTLTNCTFSENFADYGGGMHCYGNNPILVDCYFSRNSADMGGGMCCIYSYPTVSSCVFSDNSANSNGGGMYCEYSDPILTNCTLTGNSAIGFYPDGYGGGLYHSGEYSPSVTNCTFAGNYAGEDGAGICSLDDSMLLIQNSIICNSLSGSGIYAFYSDPIMLYNNVYGNVDGDYGGWAGPGEGDISADPCFANPGHWEDPCGTPGDMTDDVWVVGDYHLKSEGGRWDPNSEMWVLDAVTSPCIDAGDPDACYVGDEQYPNGGRINMGAYGGTNQASKASRITCWEEAECAGQCSGDATCDGKVNLADLVALKANFGMAAPWVDNNCCADFTHDGSVNLGDLVRLKEGFGSMGYSPSTGNQACPP